MHLDDVHLAGEPAPDQGTSADGSRPLGAARRTLPQRRVKCLLFYEKPADAVVWVRELDVLPAAAPSGVLAITTQVSAVRHGGALPSPFAGRWMLR